MDVLVRIDIYYSPIPIEWQPNNEVEKRSTFKRANRV